MQHMQVRFPLHRCSPPSETIFAQCKSPGNSTQEMFISGDVVLRETEPDLPPLWANMMAAAGGAFVLRLGAYLVLRYWRNPSKHGIK